MSQSYPPGPPAYGQPQYAPPIQAVYAGFWLRFVAIFIDGILINIVMTAVGSAIGVTPYMIFAAMRQPYIMAALGYKVQEYHAISLILSWLYFALLESSSWRGTIGKRALSIMVVDYNGNRLGFGQATGRYFGKIISALILMIGFIMAGFTQRKQALHDIMARTLVVRRV